MGEGSGALMTTGMTGTGCGVGMLDGPGFGLGAVVGVRGAQAIAADMRAAPIVAH